MPAEIDTGRNWPAADIIDGAEYTRVKVNFGVDGVATDVSANDPLPVTGTMTVAANPLPVSLATAPALVASTAIIGKVATPSFSVSDSLTRPANTTAYATNKAINCNVSVTAFARSGNTITLTAANAFAVGDRITVAGVNAGFTATNVDGNWIAKAGTNATTVVFDVTNTPTGTTPQTITVGAIAKLLSVVVADAVGNGVIISRVSLAMQGVQMTGAVRVYIYTQPTTALVDQSTFTLLTANDTYRRDYIDLYPVTEGTGSDVTFASQRLWEVFKCDPADTRLYFRLVSEAANTPISGGIITLRVTGVQLLG